MRRFTHRQIINEYGFCILGCNKQIFPWLTNKNNFILLGRMRMTRDMCSLLSRGHNSHLVMSFIFYTVMMIEAYLYI